MMYFGHRNEMLSFSHVDGLLFLFTGWPEAACRQQTDRSDYAAAGRVAAGLQVLQCMQDSLSEGIDQVIIRSCEPSGGYLSDGRYLPYSLSRLLKNGCHVFKSDHHQE